MKSLGYNAPTRDYAFDPQRAANYVLSDHKRKRSPNLEIQRIHDPDLARPARDTSVELMPPPAFPASRSPQRREPWLFDNRVVSPHAKTVPRAPPPHEITGAQAWPPRETEVNPQQRYETAGLSPELTEGNQISWERNNHSLRSVNAPPQMQHYTRMDTFPNLQNGSHAPQTDHGYRIRLPEPIFEQRRQIQPSTPSPQKRQTLHPNQSNSTASPFFKRPSNPAHKKFLTNGISIATGGCGRTGRFPGRNSHYTHSRHQVPTHGDSSNTLNGLSFIEEPLSNADHTPIVRKEPLYSYEHTSAILHTPRDAHGLFQRPDAQRYDDKGHPHPASRYVWSQSIHVPSVAPMQPAAISNIYMPSSGVKPRPAHNLAPIRGVKSGTDPTSRQGVSQNHAVDVGRQECLWSASGGRRVVRR